jgi:glycerol-3-phosphate dehydrogenase
MTKSGELREKINTAKLSRSHVLESSQSGLISIMGGKWTIYRRMGEDAVNAALDHIAQVEPKYLPNLEEVKNKTTYYLPLLGDYRNRNIASNEFSEKIDHTIYHKTLVNKLEEKKVVEDLSYLNYLSRNYGKRSFDILNMISNDRDLKEQVHPNHKMTKAEVLYFTRYEQVVSPLDLLLRRSRLGFVDSASAEESLPIVIDIIGNEYGWDDNKKKSEYLANLELFKKMKFANISQDTFNAN